MVREYIPLHIELASSSDVLPQHAGTCPTTYLGSDEVLTDPLASMDRPDPGHRLPHHPARAARPERPRRLRPLLLHDAHPGALHALPDQDAEGLGEVYGAASEGYPRGAE